MEEEEPAIDLSVIYTAEVFRNTRGGLGRGTRYLDNFDMTLTVDGERALGWRGATLFAYGLYNNGEPFSDDLVGAVQGVSNIETGVGAARLYEAWIEQRFASDRASVKLGLYDLNSEFDAIEAAALFLNPSHGIGPDFSQSGRNGPSIFPVTSLAIRGDYRLAD
ncbi:MAG: carbohydrate porin, partial [Pseudomonadota bacterium]|nr:carbohydrate porin [Pseudomonadota bacterium]